MHVLLVLSSRVAWCVPRKNGTNSQERSVMWSSCQAVSELAGTIRKLRSGWAPQYAVDLVQSIPLRS